MPLFLIPNAANLTGDTLAAGVTASSLTSVGTLSALTVSGTSTLGVTRVSGADNSLPFGVSGATRGVRINVSSFGSTIEGVDNTLVGSYQPLNIAASVLALYTTGGNAIALGTSGSTPQMYVTNTASAVNFAQITGGVTGNAVRYGVGGSDSNVTWAASSKGTFGLGFYTNDFTNLQFAVSHTASAVNYAVITGSATGGNVTYGVAGSDTNISKEYRTKGAGFHLFTTNTGQVQLQITHTASAVNYWSVSGAATGGNLDFIATGNDTNIQGRIFSKGNGKIVFGGEGVHQVRITPVASAVNTLDLSGSATGNAVTASAAGSDSNIDFAITPKGTGNVRFGTHSAIAAETVTGYITIKDSSGTERKLAVLS